MDTLQVLIDELSHPYPLKNGVIRSLNFNETAESYRHANRSRFNPSFEAEPNLRGHARIKRQIQRELISGSRSDYGWIILFVWN